MDKVEIKHRWTGNVLFTCELPADIAALSTGKQIGHAFTEARKAGINLSDAYLRGADLRDAYLSGADLRGADLRDAIGALDNLSEAAAETTEQRLTREAERAARFRERFPDIPVVPQLDAKILAVVEAKPDAFDMGSWHGDEDEPGPMCETTHCRAGWAVHLAGEAGYALENKFDAETAGRKIYMASVGYIPNFFADNAVALADIKARAAEQVSA